MEVFRLERGNCRSEYSVGNCGSEVNAGIKVEIYSICPNHTNKFCKCWTNASLIKVYHLGWSYLWGGFLCADEH